MLNQWLKIWKRSYTKGSVDIQKVQNQTNTKHSSNPEVIFKSAKTFLEKT